MEGEGAGCDRRPDAHLRSEVAVRITWPLPPHALLLTALVVVPCASVAVPKALPSTWMLPTPPIAQPEGAVR